MVLPADDVAFFWAATRQLAPDRRPAFVEQVAGALGAHPDPGPGDVDRALRAAWVDLWDPPALEERPARWDRGRPSFQRISKAAREVPVAATMPFRGD